MNNITIIFTSLGILALGIWILFAGSLPIQPYEYEMADVSEIKEYEQSMAKTADKLAKSCQELGGVFTSSWDCDTGDARTFYSFSDGFVETSFSKQCAQYADYKRIDLPVKCEKYPY